MQRHEFLRQLHKITKPKTYLEVGVNTGGSLRLSRCRTIAIDPAFRIVHPVRCNLALFKATSDDHFARDDAFAHFRGRPTDLSFIDGMHLFEFALRDFINVERNTDWSSVVVLDDMLPRTIPEAARDRDVSAGTGAWAGDVFKIIPTLREYRPDLLLLPVDTQPTGVLVVLVPDAGNRTLSERYDEIERRYAVDDPQSVPDDILSRECAVDPRQLLDAPFWEVLLASRDKGRDSAKNGQRLADAVRETFPDVDGGGTRRRLRNLLPG